MTIFLVFSIRQRVMLTAPEEQKKKKRIKACNRFPCQAIIQKNSDS